MIPIIILFFIAVPSILNLYLNEAITNPLITIKAIGHQWYWTFEYSDFKDNFFESFIIKNSNLRNFNFLDTDYRFLIPYNFNIRLIVSSLDVIHSFSLPSLGIKVDAIPGRLNQVNLICHRPGIYFGQCSEICGVNHSFIPITLEAINLNKFLNLI